MENDTVQNVDITIDIDASLERFNDMVIFFKKECEKIAFKSAYCGTKPILGEVNLDCAISDIKDYFLTRLKKGEKANLLTLCAAMDMIDYIRYFADIEILTYRDATIYDKLKSLRYKMCDYMSKIEEEDERLSR